MLHNPISTDTIAVPARSWTYARVRFDNPGYWFLHCHVTIHMCVPTMCSLVEQYSAGAQQLGEQGTFGCTGPWGGQGTSVRQDVGSCQLIVFVCRLHPEAKLLVNVPLPCHDLSSQC